MQQYRQHKSNQRRDRYRHRVARQQRRRDGARVREVELELRVHSAGVGGWLCMLCIKLSRGGSGRTGSEAGLVDDWEDMCVLYTLVRVFLYNTKQSDGGESDDDSGRDRGRGRCIFLQIRTSD